MIVVAVVFMVVIGVPIMVAFGLSTVAYLSTVTMTPMLVVMGCIDEGMSSLILLAIPLFVFLGALIEAMGMAQAMIRFLASLIGHLFTGGFVQMEPALFFSAITAVSIETFFRKTISRRWARNA